MAKYIVQIGKQLAKQPGGDSPRVWRSRVQAEAYAKIKPDAFVLKLRKGQRPRPIQMWWL